MIGNNGLVTCVIPTHNRAKLLPRAIESVLGQSYQCFELLVVDNASSDETTSVIAEYEKKDPRVRYLSYTNSANASAARNFGLFYAKGAYVAFLDDDDEWLTNKLELQLRYIDHYSIIGCRCINIHLNFQKLSLFKQQIEDIILIRNGDIREVTVTNLLRDNSGLSPSTMIMATQPLRQLGGFDEKLVGPEGRDLFIRTTSSFGTGGVLNERLVVRHEEHNLSSISTKPVLIEGAWREYNKNRHLMNDAQNRYRLIQIYFYETLYSDRSSEVRRMALRNAFRQLRLRELGSQIPLFLILFLFHGKKILRMRKLL